MDFEVHCMSILPTELLLFSSNKVNPVLQSIAPLNHRKNALSLPKQFLLEQHERRFPVSHSECCQASNCPFAVATRGLLALHMSAPS